MQITKYILTGYNVNDQIIYQADGITIKDLASNVLNPKTLRDEFAMAALQGMLGNALIIDSLSKSKMDGAESKKHLAEGAYQYADVMLKAKEDK